MKNAIFNWSGGKDSAFALYKIQQEMQYNIKHLLTTINYEYKRISMHGVREKLLELQTSSLGIDLRKIYLPEFPSMENYDKQMRKELTAFKETGIQYTVFGDIFLEDLRQYRENQLAQIGMNAVFPLWKINTKELMMDFINSGFKAIVVCVDERFLDKTFAGKIIDKDFIDSLPDNVDPCGENGEFHSFVFDGPNFKSPINFMIGELVYKKYVSDNKTSNTSIQNKEKFSGNKRDNGYWYCDILE